MTQGLELRGAVLGKGYRLGLPLDETDENVYAATHERIPGHFVIRLFPTETLSQPESSSRIQRGARVASLLRDPHAVQVLDFNASGEVPAFVVMERQQGQSLASVMAEGALPLSRVVELVQSIAEALAAGHRIGLVHGDLRPAHVALPTDGGPSARVSGFGWAKELRAAARVSAPSGYLAPEQKNGHFLTLDERVDQFALAALAYELIAARHPFPVDAADPEVPPEARRPPRPLSELVPGVPKAVDQVLRRAMSATPAERFNGVIDFASQLRDSSSMTAEEGEPLNAGATPVDIVPLAALPMKPSSDVTEELDLATLSPVHVEDDDENDAATAETYDRAIEAAGAADDETDDAKLVLGPKSGPTKLGPTKSEAPVSDDAATQIVRSPFFELDRKAQMQAEADADADAENDDGDGRIEARAPLRRSVPVGLPIGRPPLGAVHRPSPASGVPLLLPHPASARSEALLTGAKVYGAGALWATVRQHRRWIAPSAMGLGLVILVGTMLWMSRDDDEVAAIPPVVAPQPTPTATPTPTPTSATPSPGQGDEGQRAAPATPPPQAAPVVARVEPLPASDESGAAQPKPDSGLRNAGGPAAPAVAGQANRPAVRRPTARPAPTGVAALAGGAARLPALAPDECAIRISSRPWAEVWIDGKNTGRKTPVDNLKVACGARKLELKRPDKDIEQMEMLDVLPGKAYRGDYELE